MAIPMMGYILAWIFPLYVNFFNKESMDLHRNTDINVTEKVSELERGGAEKPVAVAVEDAGKETA